MEKNKLRQLAHSRRQAMSKEEVTAKSQSIAEHFINAIKLDNVKTIHLYKPISSLNEPDTKYISDQLDPGVRVAIGMSYKSSILPKQKFDLIIVPCLAFDKNCNRLGWGGGWYDRFLAKQPQALKIGLAYHDSFVPGGIPAEAHDIALDKVITEV